MRIVESCASLKPSSQTDKYAYPIQSFEVRCSDLKPLKRVVLEKYRFEDLITIRLLNLIHANTMQLRRLGSISKKSSEHEICITSPIPSGQCSSSSGGLEDSGVLLWIGVRRVRFMQQYLTKKMHAIGRVGHSYSASKLAL
jgi:hypothetical protein